MKRGLTFLLGMIAGCVLTIAALLFVGGAYLTTSKTEGLEIYGQPVSTIESSSFKVMQVLPNGNALANSESSIYKDLSYTGFIVLLLADENSHFYDGQIVNVPKGKQAYQVGIFDYETNGIGHKTVPAVRFLDK